MSTNRPGGALVLEDALWVTNDTANRIEIFDLATGQRRSAVGRRGDGPGEFGWPMGLAALPDGGIGVVDVLGRRVQVLERDGRWRRDIGGPRTNPGLLSQPRNIAIGPDAAVFVSDTAGQCVHAFDAGGRHLATFGGPDAGVDALTLPAGLAIVSAAPHGERALPADFPAAYYVLVCEQMARPGIRVFGWRAPSSTEASAPRGAPKVAETDRSIAEPGMAARASNPHWNPAACTSCHAQDGDALRPIAADRVDAVCVGCHDSRKAPAEAHPIGWPAITAQTRAADGWPLVNGRIGCLTCHDIRRHCDATRARPRENAALVRGWAVDDPLASCLECHRADQWRWNPHRAAVLAGAAALRPGSGQAGPAGAARTVAQTEGLRVENCGFCHAQRPALAADGVRHGHAQLRGGAGRR